MRPRRPVAMDLMISKWLIYVVIALVVAYGLVHFEALRGAFRTLRDDILHWVP
jgi:hypothetical protein